MYNQDRALRRTSICDIAHCSDSQHFVPRLFRRFSAFELRAFTAQAMGLLMTWIELLYANTVLLNYSLCKALLEPSIQGFRIARELTSLEDV